MSSTISSISLSYTPKILAKASDSPKIKSPWLNQPWRRSGSHWTGQRMMVRPMAKTPDLSEKVAESIKEAEETCAGDPASGECVAAWDEVEELSAAASHAKDRQKASDPLEEFCKDNMETEECRTYED
ncbi:hypothetical protein ACET3Z_019102 [Daucus carota]